MNLTSLRVRRMARPALIVLCCLAVGLSTGCGNSTSSGKLYPVAGKVVVQGNAPMSKGGVRFKPDRSQGNTSTLEPVGVIQSDGSYVLFTNGQRGAPAGWYKISVSPGGKIDSARPFAAAAPIAQCFTNPDTSGLSVEVGPTSSSGQYDLYVTLR